MTKSIAKSDLYTENIDILCSKISMLVDYARNISVKSINVIQTITYFCLGKWIIEFEQEGNLRAKYGKKVLIKLSDYLSNKYEKGFSVDTLENARKFDLYK